MSENPHRGPVVDLVDPYLDQQAKNASASSKCGGEYAAWWLRTHPGRWALVGEGSTGLSRDLLHGMGLTGVRRTSKIDGITRHYGQSPHIEAETLAEALSRRPIEGIYLPPFEKSEFDWTPGELDEACSIARSEAVVRITYKRLHVFPFRKRR